MKARLIYACLPVAANVAYEIEDIHLDVEVPIVPTVGMMLKPYLDADYLQVADVFLDLCPGGEGLVIGLKEPETEQLRSWPEMQALGWQLTNPD